MTEQRWQVLTSLFSADTELSGADVMRLTGLASGSVYPILYALEGKGLLESRQETEAPQQLRRPRRCLYRLTAIGIAEVREEAAARLAALRPFDFAES